MSVTHHLVPPNLPTALADDTHVDLPGQDTWILYLDNVHVIPEKLDVSKFEDALSRVLQLYPHAAGKLQCTDGRFSVKLTNSGVPVDIEYKLGMSTDSLLDGSWVVQDDLSSFLNPHPVGVNPIDGGAPLLRLKLTFFDQETCIGVTWNHSLCDAIMMSRFMHTLSQFYQGLLPRFPPPTFKKNYFPTLSTEAKLSAPPHLTRHFDVAAFMASRADLQNVRWRIDIRDLESLRSAFASENETYTSKHDFLTAYVVGVLNSGRNTRVQSVVNVCSYRHISAPFVPENVAGNLILFAPAKVPTDVAGIAAGIRESLVRSREPSCVHILESLNAEHMIKAANAGSPLPYSFDDDELLVNSNAVIDWRSSHFGFPETTRFYTHGVFKGTLRCFKSNPVRGENGIWQADAIDISIGVSAEVKIKMLETLGRGVQHVLDGQRVQA